ncbi:putative vesicle-associated protein 2-1-like [Capsicum annuum]|uniref:uncharacterized protein LOC107868332 isoform X1 n=1 Tax=Capsicum annuum TaxID=4072 RepID=UPI001FB149BA|nr:uncharacterized protein LOC107868332 isoform X1 [Capsicum annuum]KAF3649350.1 putative vesicle-associated protein 2-1-like [Capsicum annuum]
MELQLTSLSTTTAISDINKAWHIFALLLSTGRPAQLSELSSKCNLFSASPEYIEFLCSIPNSPIHLTSNYFVTFSKIGFKSTVEFFANADVDVVRGRGEKECITRTYFRKRKRGAGSEVEYPHLGNKRGFFNKFDGKERSQVMMPLPSMAQMIYEQGYVPKGNLSCGINPLTRILSSLARDFNGFYEMFRTCWIIDGSARPSSSGLKSIEYECKNKTERGENSNESNYVHIPICKSKVPSHSLFSSTRSMKVESITDSMLQLNPHPASSLETTFTSTASEMVGNTEKKLNSCINSCTIVDKEMEFLPSAADASVHGFERMSQKENFVEDSEEEPASYPVNHRNVNCTKTHPTKANISPQDDLLEENATKECSTSLLHIDRVKKDKPLQSHAILARTQSFRQKQQGKPVPNSTSFQRDESDHRELRNSKAPKNHKTPSLFLNKEQPRTDPKLILMKLKHKKNYDLDMGINERKENPYEHGDNFVCNSAKNQSEQNQLPNFESYFVEEAEGSGGYGTVYRARRKSDGVKVAIKCPHSNANRTHVHNELKMLQRFGGKNFVIKYEGSFKNGNSDCLVLEHVEHDRPDVLKREMDVSQLRWYGYCMFRALAGLHKQGIVHRDVKPGNFLFSRKVDKGYLIDFNLALDLHQKYGTSDKTKSIHTTSFSGDPIPLAKSLPPIKQRNSTIKLGEDINEEAGKGVKSLIRHKNVKRKADQDKVGSDIAYRSIIKSKCADGSGITSAKDATSNRTPSAERLREPLPRLGRKALIDIAAEVVHQHPNNVDTKGPTSKRKRVAATPGKVENKYVCITPMPLHSSGIAIGGAGLLKGKGDRKQKREGPCVGTKGFRAPEVLFRSTHQGTKLDIWSAGVTLLYFIIGRTPFTGDPDQNIKEIVKFKGSEDLWEVAKLHNRESSFPADLFDMKSMSPMKLREWCSRNTRKSDFLEIIPQSLLDLVDKCLTSNPRLRISAEEALRHDFFAPCYEALRKQRLHRQRLTNDLGSTLTLPENSESCGVL